MIYTVALNPAIDYVIETESAVPGRINAYHSAVYGAGGKAVNVARVAASLGMPVKTVGFAAGFTGEEIIALLARESCGADFIRLPGGHSRINIKICDSAGGETDFNGTGPALPENAIAQVVERLSALTRDDHLVLSGSLPSGMHPDTYAQIMRQTAHSGARITVDAAGDALRLTLAHRPFLIKPNQEELAALFETKIETVADAMRYARLLQRAGARNVIVSLGAGGAVLLREDGGICRYSAISGRAVSTVGAGDSLVAGFLYGYGLTGDADTALRWGIAAGAATAFRKGLATGDEIRRLMEEPDTAPAKTPDAR